MKTTSLLLICGLLLAAAPSAEAAGKVKGLKGAAVSKPEVTRRLKEAKDDKGGKAGKTKAAKGPQSRSCQSTASKKEVTFECSSRSADLKAAKKSIVEKPEELTGGQLDDVSARGITVIPDKSIEDSIKYRVQTRKEGIKIKIEYDQEVVSVERSLESESEFELLFDRVIEYKKSPREMMSNGEDFSEAYDWENDEVLQTIDLTKWDDIPGITSDEASVVHFFTAETALESNNKAPGTIQFNYTISQADQSEQITANSMKIDIRILNFPWRYDDSYVALLSTIKSKKTVNMDYDPEAVIGSGNTLAAEDVYIAFDDEMADMGISAFGEYTWASEAEASNDAIRGPSVSTARQGAAPNATMPEEETVDAVDGATVVEDGAIIEDGGIVEDSSQRPGKPPTDGPPGVAETVQEQGGSGPLVGGADGSSKKIQVIATSPPEQGDDNTQFIAYSFVGKAAHSATDIYWDPKAGISYEEPITAESAAGRQMLGLVTSMMGAMMMYLIF